MEAWGLQLALSLVITGANEVSLFCSAEKKSGVGAGIQASNHKVPYCDRARFGSVLGEGSREPGTGS